MKEKFTRLWEYIVIANLVLSILALWSTVSQSIFLSQLVTSKYLTVAQNSPSTTQVVINPLTTQAFLITAFSGVGLVISLATLVALFFVFKKKD